MEGGALLFLKSKKTLAKFCGVMPFGYNVAGKMQAQ